MSRLLVVPMAAGLSMLVVFGAARPAEALEKFGEPEFKCVSFKQWAAGQYSWSAFAAWAEWEHKQDDARRDRRLERAGAKLARTFAWAEAWSERQGVDCVEQTLAADNLEVRIASLVSDVAASINDGLDLGDRVDAKCGAKLLGAAGMRSWLSLVAESFHTRRAPLGGVSEWRDWLQSVGERIFGWRWSQAHCPISASEAEVAAKLDALSQDVVFHTTVAPGLDATEFQPVTPATTVEYEGSILQPRCAFDNDPDYHFFVKRGSVNKVVMYYQGGGACWGNTTCSIPVCKSGADPVDDDPDHTVGGFADLNNPDNPFKDWNVVFVTYCSCDIHYGDADQTYAGIFPDISVKHRGFHNSRVAEKFAREHFLNPEVVFAVGSSAGAYGAVFHGALLHDVWPASKFRVLGDAGSGAITADFLQNEFGNWNFEANLPTEVPGVVESISSGEGMVAYIEAVATFYDQTNWAHYTTAYDGGTGGQSGFYNIMLNGSNPLAALSWWDASCAFHQTMVDQAADTFSRVPENYRYYIGAGSRHTTWGINRVYFPPLGGESQSIVDWVREMIEFEPGVSSPGDWKNVECEDCETLLFLDPAPPSFPTAPFFIEGGRPVIRCPN